MCTRWWRARLEGLGQQDCVGRDRVEFNGGEVGTWRDWLWGEINERERERERERYERREKRIFFFFFAFAFASFQIWNGIVHQY